MSLPGPSPPPADVQASFCDALVDEFVRAGVRHAVVCPGSRNTPLAAALAAARHVRVHVRLDERSAGFYALGIGLASETPAVACVTSGTAAAELHAAVVEADLARVPMLVCTADRPPELRGVGAPQTIDQQHLYGVSARWFVDAGVPDLSCASAWRSIGSRAVAEARAGRAGPGPVHLNLPFREPLLGKPTCVPAGRPDGASWHETTGRSELSEAALADRLVGRRGLIVAGARPGSPKSVLALAAALGWPVFADPRSGCRLADDDGVIAAADGILRSDRAAIELAPEVVVRLGAPWASKVLAGRLHAWSVAGCEQIVVDPWWRWLDPERDATHVVVADPTEWCEAAAARVGTSGPATTGSWRARWTAAEAAAQEAIQPFVSGSFDAGAPEPAVAHWVLRAVTDDTAVVVSSSMPVRDLEWFGPRLLRPPLVLANRGANGIDGVVSTALGVAATCDDPDSVITRVVAVVGDLAFLHDLTALVRLVPSIGAAELRCTIVVVDNCGGGIFSFLPQKGALDSESFELLFGTPPEVDIASVARGLGITVKEPSNLDELIAAISHVDPRAGITVVHVRTLDRQANIEVHATISAAVVAAVERVL